MLSESVARIERHDVERHGEGFFQFAGEAPHVPPFDAGDGEVEIAGAPRVVLRAAEEN